MRNRVRTTKQNPDEVIVWSHAGDGFAQTFLRLRPKEMGYLGLIGLVAMSLWRAQSGMWYIRYRFASHQIAEKVRQERSALRSALEMEYTPHAGQLPFFEDIPDGSYELVAEEASQINAQVFVMSFMPLDGFEAFIVGMWQSLTRDLGQRLGSPVELTLYLRGDGEQGYFVVESDVVYTVSVMKNALDAALAEHQLNVVMARTKVVPALPEAAKSWETWGHGAAETA